MIQVTYSDRKGAGCMRAFDKADDAAGFLSRVRTEATARDSKGEVVGECYQIPAYERVGSRRWGWWIDNEAN